MLDLDSSQAEPPANDTGFGQPKQRKGEGSSGAPPADNTGFGQPQQQQQQAASLTILDLDSQQAAAPLLTIPRHQWVYTNTTRPYNATLTGVPENLKHTNNETAASFARTSWPCTTASALIVGVSAGSYGATGLAADARLRPSIWQ